ncbi:MAG: hypothetical protein IMZ51_05970 [Chloroflexi bacterium]|nr:hypothetical protein [Chloroflexota bacterium]
MNKAIIELGNKIDIATDSKDTQALKDCIALSQEMESTGNLSNDEKAILFYFTGNAWASLDHILNYESFSWLYKRKEFEKAIIYYRRVLGVEKLNDFISKNILSQNYTNLGNMFSQAGRIIAAIDYWDKALLVYPDFGMAKCNKAHGLIYYSKMLYDKSHQTIMLKNAYKLLKTSIEDNTIHKKAKITFRNDIKYIGSLFKKENLESEITFKKFSLGKSKKEIAYRKWVIKNKLFINPLNDILQVDVVSHDVLGLPNLRIRDNPAPIYHGFFSQIKQEYITLRYLFYKYLIKNETKIHFSDEGRHLNNTLDYPQFGLRYEYLKLSFRMAYSLFDKISYFLNKYLDLGFSPDEVSFRKIWFIKKGNDYFINPKIQELNNLPLRGLYFLSKDLYEKNEEYSTSIEPESYKLAEIRNHIEHKYFKIHWDMWSGKTEHTGDQSMDMNIDNWSYSLYENDFAHKTSKIINLAREAIIYLSLALHHEEIKEKANSITMPLIITEYDF